MDESGASSATTHGSGQSVSVIISDTAARWLVIVFLSFAAAYAVVRAETSHDAAAHAQQEADLAKYYTIDMETYLYKQGLTPPPDPWRSNGKGQKK
jgi:hypothetical protein